MQITLDKIKAIFVEELRENLVGLYLHGSLAMGCFNPSRSDIDLLIVVKEPLPTLSAKQLSHKILSLRDEIENGIECSVILEAALLESVYPTPCEFHFSDYHREQYRANEHYLIGGYEDQDLASQITVAYHRGRTLYGRPLADLYPPIDSQHYLASILHDIEGASDAIMENPLYLTLNLCRVLYFIREGKISSKKEGGIWGVENVPNPYRDLVQFYLNEYTGVSTDNYGNPSQLSAFAEYMLMEIKKELSKV
ncbi:aminoglycoside adenylyltransferase domain-containing protein [Gorillibacterium timonense]|uniref:aminoglycoside adenylyltransferase domain-containing protein n=1 Tax=Gorillibacterium timonense TaxID=1689269 RepID=UPI00071D5C9F|nr:aminoglycoside adenylyltransferase domain-containing protein [Gorillibacterium timonense]